MTYVGVPFVIFHYLFAPDCSRVDIVSPCMYPLVLSTAMDKEHLPFAIP